MPERPYLAIEIIGSFFIFIAIFITISPHFKKMPEEAKIAAAKNNLAVINNALAMYFTSYNTYPTSEQIYSLQSLKTVLSPYLNKEEMLNSLDFISYQQIDADYELVVMVGGKVLKATPNGIVEEE